jgi:hypothetical protein
VKILPLLLALIALFLPACGTLPARDASPESDLTALKSNAESHLAPRTLDSGRLYCWELATTEGLQDECGPDLEELAWLSERDKARALALVQAFVKRATLQRLACRWYQVRCHARRRAIERDLQVLTLPP